MTKGDEISSAFAICLLLVTLAFIAGIATQRYLFKSPDVDVDCLADRVEWQLSEGIRKGYFFTGLLRRENTLDAAVKWYDYYKPVSRGLLEREIDFALTKCKRGKINNEETIEKGNASFLEMFRNETVLEEFLGRNESFPTE